jgi:hypothetical protein
MHKLGLIGSHGLFGNEICKFYTPVQVYNSNNIHELPQEQFDLVICAAPGANRRIAQHNPQADFDSVDRIIAALSAQRIQRLVLIGTIDSVVYPDTAYGRNRLRLETFVKQEFEHHYVLRFGNIVGASIKKNVLFDLKHNQFLENINLDSFTQWYPLKRLQTDIEHALLHSSYEQTLVSAPIQVKEIVERFFPEKLTHVGTNPGAISNYNLPSVIDKQQVFDCMSEYCE